MNEFANILFINDNIEVIKKNLFKTIKIENINIVMK